MSFEIFEILLFNLNFKQEMQCDLYIIYYITNESCLTYDATYIIVNFHEIYQFGLVYLQGLLYLDDVLNPTKQIKVQSRPNLRNSQDCTLH